jgi:hypothetical protein
LKETFLNRVNGVFGRENNTEEEELMSAIEQWSTELGPVFLH